MLKRSWIIALALGAVAFSGCTVYTRPARARVTVSGQATAPGTVVYNAPPARRTVTVRPAAPYAGAVWVDGHWQWDGYQYVWADGYWVQPRAGYTYVQPRWERRGNGYVYVQGNWRAGGGRTVVRTNRTVVRPRGRTTVVRGPRGTVRRTTTVRGRGPATRTRTTTVRGPRGNVRSTTRVNTPSGSRTRTTTVRGNGRGRTTTTTTRRRNDDRGRGRGSARGGGRASVRVR